VRKRGVFRRVREEEGIRREVMQNTYIYNY
jgi:hypothetical protein